MQYHCGGMGTHGWITGCYACDDGRGRVLLSSGALGVKCLACWVAGWGGQGGWFGSRPLRSLVGVDRSMRPGGGWDSNMYMVSFVAYLSLLFWVFLSYILVG
ncbi:uncharacterized protein EI90DRAFT_2521123 [Cantharellus anzutake]|uniref:uncharacterized protein n=1 Tax=Cantharellus anzutake TaxID=1750568 RepID=UPI001908AA54|nr:uncharacterized protein EI90DRAFT_2521123 [Cantharellus anzutake]KAF8337912.1 hypothetical protein EI90DRAFT_2521123 [Cantharellus anzutake]